jgi:putative transcriptional regulator
MKWKELREKKFMTQRELAEKAGVTVETISRLENGKYKPRFSTIKKLAKALGVEPNMIEFS